MAGLPAFLLRHTVTIEAYEGTDGNGVAHYVDAVTVVGFLDDKVRRARRVTGTATGDEVVSTSTLYVALDTAAPVSSRVTLPSGRVATVITALRRDGGGLPTPDHLEILLT